MSDSRRTNRQVVILAGGLGTRLRPLTETVPKPMVPVAEFPFLYWQLLDLKAQGYKDVLLLVAYLGEQVEAYFGRGVESGLNLTYCYEREPLGTGGALKNAVALLDDEFILLNGDSFLQAPLHEMERAFVGLDALVSTYDNRVAMPVIPNIKTENALVTGYEKDAVASRGYTEIDSGIYILKRSLVASMAKEKFMLADIWPALIREKKLGAFRVRERFYDIGTIERLKEFEEKVRDYFPHTVSN